MHCKIYNSLQTSFQLQLTVVTCGRASRLRRRLIRVSIRNNGYCFPGMCISLLISSFKFCHFRKGEKRNYVRKKLSENVRLHSGILSPSLSYRMQNTLLNYNKLAYDQSSSRKTKHKYLLMLLICRIS